jgi:2-deoxy-D-gluconate 3-dehydrogenase
MGVLDQFRLDGKVALVTGANRGLGQAMALALAEAGATLIGLSLESDCTETAAALAALGKPYQHLTVDLGALTAPELLQVVEQASAVHGRLDILVNNAGMIRRQAALEFTEADWDSVLQINLKAVFFLAQAAARQMVKQGSGGKIINIASMLSFQGGINVPSYTASKHGVVGITRALANEWAGQGIGVNAIAPGYMATDNTAALRADERRSAAILERIPAGRWGTPHDLQGAVVFLASAAADYVQGTVLAVDGGWLAR